MAYGQELILDLHKCNPVMFTRYGIGNYFQILCNKIDMEACDLHFWDDLETPEDEKQTDPKTTGTSAIQFIVTSNITIHALDLLGNVYVNLFSCKTFDANIAAAFTAMWFEGKIVNRVEVNRL